MNVDVIIATYNRPELLTETLGSVAGQTYPHWTCWIVEDGETEETSNAVQPFLEDDRFQYLPGEHAGFPAAPRNRGIRMGSAGYIAMLDDDDLWLPEKLERQVEFLDTHPDCVLLGCNAFYWSGTGSWEECPVYFKKNILGNVRYTKMLKQNYVIHSSAMMRRNALEQAGLYNEILTRNDDYELLLRIGALGKIWVLSEPYVVYRDTPSTFNPELGRIQNYQAAAHVFESALRGVGNTPSPLSFPENSRFAEACRRERDFYRAGPRFLGRLRHEIHSKIRDFLGS